MTLARKRWVGGFGIVLLVGGVAHTVGVLHLYFAKGTPNLDRILLDVWIAEAQIVAGALFSTGKNKPDPGPWCLAAALVIWSYAIPFLPVLIHRAPPIFWVMPTLYSLASLGVLRWVAERSPASR